MFITPETQPFLQVVATFLPVLNKYATDLLQRLGVETDGRTLSRNIGTLLVICFSLGGLLAAPAISAPTVPEAATIVDYLVSVSSFLTQFLALLAYVIAGSRVYNDAVDKDSTPTPVPAPEPPVEPVPTPTATRRR